MLNDRNGDIRQELMGTATNGRVLGGGGGLGDGRVVLDANAGCNLSKLVPTQEGAYTRTYTTTITTTTVDAVVLHWLCHHHHSFIAEVMIIID